MSALCYFREIFGFALPIYIANLFQQFYHATDTIIIGNLLGEQVLAAVGAVSGISYLIFNVSAGVTSGYSVEIAKAYGAGSRHLSGLIKDSLISSFVLGLGALVLFSCASRLILGLLNVPGEILELAHRYVIILYFGLPVTLLHNMLGAALRAVGDSKTPSAALIFSILLNLALDALLVGPMKMGVRGAAFATVISQAVSGIICAVTLTGKHGVSLNAVVEPEERRENIRAINRIGLPYGLQFLVTSVGINAVQRAVNHYGAACIAGFSAANKLHAVFAQLHVALGTALMTLTAQDEGANRSGRVFERAAKLFPLFMLCAVCNGLILGFGGEYLASLFARNSTAEMIKAARTYFLTVIWFYPFLTAIFHVRNVLTGLGKSSRAVVGSGVEFVVRISVSSLLPTAASYAGICFSDPLAWLAGLIPLVIFYRYERSLRVGKGDF